MIKIDLVEIIGFSGGPTIRYKRVLKERRGRMYELKFAAATSDADIRASLKANPGVAKRDGWQELVDHGADDICLCGAPHLIDVSLALAMAGDEIRIRGDFLNGRYTVDVFTCTCQGNSEQWLVGWLETRR